MSTIPPTPQPPHAEQLDALRLAYPAWHINRAAFGGVMTEWKSENGLQIRVVHGTSVPDLHRRLEIIEAARADSEL